MLYNHNEINPKTMIRLRDLSFYSENTGDDMYKKDMAALERRNDEHNYRAVVYQTHFSDELYLTLCGVGNCLPDYCFHTENRPGYHLHVILQGKGQLSVNGKMYNLHIGQLFVTKPGEETWYKADREEPWVYCWMSFDGTQAKDVINLAGFCDGVNALDYHADCWTLYDLVTKVLDLDEDFPSCDYHRSAYLLEFIGHIMDSYSKSQEDGKTKREFSANHYIDNAVSYIRENYAVARISDIANHLGIHRSYLAGIFKKKMGVSPKEYLMQCRLNSACKQLEETDIPIHEIARKVGYDNPLTFSKTFKTHYGVSPKEYRSRKKTA